MSHPDDKRYATLAALAALQRGLIVSRTITDDGAVLYQAGRWGLLREFDSLAKLEQWLRRVGVEAPQ